jgi:hypothetical protein
VPDQAESSAGLCAKMLLIHERLCAVYECPIPYFHALDPLSELISSLLSHRTRNADSGRAYRQLRARFPEWTQVRDASREGVEAEIAPCTWPEQKAPRIQGALRRISDHCGGEPSLDFLDCCPSAVSAGLLYPSTAITTESPFAWGWSLPTSMSVPRTPCSKPCSRPIGRLSRSTTTMKSLCSTASGAVFIDPLPVNAVPSLISVPLGSPVSFPGSSGR